MFIDAHCHPQLVDFKETYLNEWQDHLLVAASTDVKDFLELELLTQRYPCLRLSIGLHPWKIKEQFPKEEFLLLKELLQKRLSTQKLPIGEVGLDLSKKYRPYIETQRQTLHHLFILGAEFQRPLILHCVKAHHELLSFLKRFPEQKIFIHGFRGSKEVIKQYLRYNSYFGLSIENFQNQVNNLPLHRIFLESDGLLPISKFKIAYEELAQIQNLKCGQIESQIEENYQSFFKDS